MVDISPKSMIRPTEVLDFGKVKIHLEGVFTPQEHYIDVMQYRYYPDLALADKAGSEYIRRLICSVVKKVEGVKWQGEPWDVQFLDESRQEITLESYVILDQVFNKLGNKKASQMVIDFYNKQKKNISDGIELELDSEEDTKKKE